MNVFIALLSSQVFLCVQLTEVTAGIRKKLLGVLSLFPLALCVLCPTNAIRYGHQIIRTAWWCAVGWWRRRGERSKLKSHKGYCVDKHSLCQGVEWENANEQFLVSRGRGKNSPTRFTCPHILPRVATTAMCAVSHRHSPIL